MKPVIERNSPIEWTAVRLLGVIRIFFIAIVCMLSASAAQAPVPKNAIPLLPVLRDELERVWPTFPTPSMLAAQVEQESCISLKHKKCWNTRAELETDREYGFGLGQITITKRFNVFEELKASDKSLSDWAWEDRFNPRMQLRAIVVKDLQAYRNFKWAKDDRERLAMTFAAYNGGVGSVIKDRKLCQSMGKEKCDPTKWFGHIEKNSFKSRIVVKGYGKSFYEINREYPVLIMGLKPRREKYVSYMDR